MGHAYVAAEGCEEASVLGVCSSAEEGLMESLMELHSDEETRAGASAEAERLSQIAKPKQKQKAKKSAA